MSKTAKKEMLCVITLDGEVLKINGAVTWEVDGDGELHLYGESSAEVATFARDSWNAVGPLWVLRQ